MTARFDDIIHPRPRLMICAALSEQKRVRFDLLAKVLESSPSALSKNVARLVEAGYVASEPDAKDQRRQWLSLTPLGVFAFAGHVEALSDLPRLAAPVTEKQRLGWEFGPGVVPST